MLHPYLLCCIKRVYIVVQKREFLEQVLISSTKTMIPRQSWGTNHLAVKIEPTMLTKAQRQVHWSPLKTLFWLTLNPTSALPKHPNSWYGPGAKQKITRRYRVSLWWRLICASLKLLSNFPGNSSTRQQRCGVDVKMLLTTGGEELVFQCYHSSHGRRCSFVIDEKHAHVFWSQWYLSAGGPSNFCQSLKRQIFDNLGKEIARMFDLWPSFCRKKS